VNLLDILLILPAAGFLLTLFLPKDNPGLIRNFVLAVSVVTFLFSLLLIGPVQATPGRLALEGNSSWIEYPAIRYHVALDGLSLWLVILSTFLTPIVTLVSWKYIQNRVKEFYAFLLALLLGVLGVFVAQDLFLFFVFWEISLVPMYFLVGIWGHDKRIYAAVKFFLYTMAGSALMLVAIIYLYNKSGTFDIPLLLDMMAKGRLVLSGTESFWLFLAFFVAFAIKVPLFPLHTWLPDAHGEAPTAGSVMLASVLLKLGTYGLVRICLPLFPGAARENANWIIVLAIAGIIYGALVAMVQPNMKRLVAYSSVSHLGFVVLGIFTFTQVGLDGAVYQMLNHGISTGALFILVGMLYERRHSLEISDFGGVATAAPWLATMFVITTLASVGLPLLNNFVGEFLVLQAAVQVNLLYGVFAAIGVILSAVYMLWMVQRVFYGETPHEVKRHMPDMSPREWAIVVPLIILMVWMGIGTQSFLPPITANNTQLLQVMKQPATPVAVQAAKESVHAR
jgi:NADH-quinone oxidoreductase subunit M